MAQVRQYRQSVPRPAWARPGSLAPWAPGRLTLAAARHRLSEVLAPPGSRLPPSAPPPAAAVLVVLFAIGGDAAVVLTRRSAGLKANPGEIAFPGGRLEPGEPPEEGALREAWEEVRLPVAAVEVLGRLPVRTRSRSPGSIVPVVGVADPLPTLEASAGEVEAIMPVPLEALRAGGAYWEELWSAPGAPDFPMAFFADPAVLGDDLVWGATARMLADLLRALAS